MVNNMNILRFFNKPKEVVQEFIDPMIGKTIIHFQTHGCQGEIEEFNYIGKIIGITYPRLSQGKKFYKIEVFKDEFGEKRDGNLRDEITEVPSWYLQKLDSNIYIAYD